MLNTNSSVDNAIYLKEAEYTKLAKLNCWIRSIAMREDIINEMQAICKEIQELLDYDNQ